MDLTGRWSGQWTGTGLLNAPREDAVTVDLVQRGDLGYGRLVFEGANAAESVPKEVRYAGLWGIRVVAEISRGAVTLRHETSGHLFIADLKVAGDGEHMYGLVRGSSPAVGLMLTRVPQVPGTPPQAAMAVPTPAERPATPIAMVTEQKETATPAPPRQEESATKEFVAVQELPAIHFDFDRADLRPDTVDTLIAHVGWLKDHADTVLLIEGHCDERGTTEYNVSLGERRAQSVRDHLSAHGIAPDRISTTSYGRERPVCVKSTDECRKINRRAEFRVKTR
jgi:peptidoglycan-associated lipoprotein